jgi:hypothetical protein
VNWRIYFSVPATRLAFMAIYFAGFVLGGRAFARWFAGLHWDAHKIIVGSIREESERREAERLP